MNNRVILANKQKVDDLFEHINDLRQVGNLQIEAQWAIYLSIRVSGLLETSIRSIFTNYCHRQSHPHIHRYIGNSFETNRSQNMKPDVILNLAGSFSKEWRENLENYLSEDGRKEAIEGILNIRNSGAHGGTLSTSYVVVKQYYEKVWEVIEFLDNQCETT